MAQTLDLITYLAFLGNFLIVSYIFYFYSHLLKYFFRRRRINLTVTGIVGVFVITTKGTRILGWLIQVHLGPNKLREELRESMSEEFCQEEHNKVACGISCSDLVTHISAAFRLRSINNTVAGIYRGSSDKVKFQKNHISSILACFYLSSRGLVAETPNSHTENCWRKQSFAYFASILKLSGGFVTFSEQ